MDIILVRHGETAWNVGEIFRGRADIDLDETRRNQAGLVAEHLHEVEIEAVYSSPLKRALHTAEAIASVHNLEVTISDGLNDLDFGEWEGSAVEVVRDLYPEQFGLWSSHPEKVRLPGGETLSEVKERALAVVDAAIASHKGSVVLVSHRVVNKILTLALLGLDEASFWNIRVDPCSVTVFSRTDGRFVLTKHNDTCFLETAKAKPLADF